MLCVDNNSQQLEQIKKDLSPLSANLTLIQATSLQQAQKLITDNNQFFSLILCAQTLKDGDPLTLFKNAQCKLSQKIIYSPSPSLQKLIDLTNQGHIDYFLQLPYQAQEFRNIIQEQITEYTKNNAESDKSTETIVNKKVFRQMRTD